MPVAEKAKKILEEFDVEYDISVASAHRTPDVLKDLVKKSDADVFIGTLEKLNEQNLGDKDPHPLVEWFFYSHPSIKNRISAISSSAGNSFKPIENTDQTVTEQEII